MTTPLLTVSVILVVAAFVCALASVWNPAKCPPWVSVILICVVLLLLVLPK